MNTAKKLLAFLMALILTFMAGCSQSGSNSAAEIYMEKAQKYVDEKNYAAAIDILQLGLEATGDDSIAEALAEVIEFQNAESENENKAKFDLDSTTDDKKDSREELIGVSSNVPDTKQMANDIVARGANCLYLNNQTEYLNVTELELLRRKTDADYDEAHVSVVLENEYYTTYAEMILYYEFYDIGGWVLEYYEMQNHVSSAKKSVVCEADVINYYGPYFDSFAITTHESGTNGNGVFSDYYEFECALEYPYMSEIFYGYYCLEFYDDYWHESSFIAPAKTDWSRVLGTWVYEQAGEVIEIEITDIVNTTEKLDSTLSYADVAFRYETSAWNNYNPNIIRQASKTPRTEALQTENVTIFKEKIAVGGDTFNISKGFFVWIKLGAATEANDSVCLEINRESGVSGINFEIDYGSESFSGYGDQKGTIAFCKIN